MKVSVKRVHIDEGHPVDKYSCPIALAILDQYPKLLGDVGVGAAVVEIQWDAFAFELDLPRDARLFIDKFDREVDEPFEPFDFILDTVRVWDRDNGWVPFNLAEFERLVA